jgi:hypothetical protein
MLALHTQETHYPIVEALIDRVTHWIKHHNDTANCARELAACGDDVSRIAGEFGMTADQLVALVQKGSGAADELLVMINELGLDAAKIRSTLPTVMRDLERNCAMCDHKSDCRRDFASHTAAAHYHDYCSNADTLDAIKAGN